MLLVAGGALAVINLLVKPILNLLLLPLNLATMGLFRWVSSVLALFLVLRVVPEFSVTGFSFAGFTYNGIVFPAFALGLWPGLVIVALIVSIITSLLLWFCH